MGLVPRAAASLSSAEMKDRPVAEPRVAALSAAAALQEARPVAALAEAWAVVESWPRAVVVATPRAAERAEELSAQAEAVVTRLAEVRAEGP